MNNPSFPGQEFLAQCENNVKRSEALLGVIDEVFGVIDENLENGVNMANEIHDLSGLIAEVHHMQDVNESATHFIQQLSAKYAEALRLSDMAAIASITETLRVSAGNLSDAITANTGVSSAPATVVVVDHAAQAAAVEARVAADAARAAQDIPAHIDPAVAAPVAAPAQEASAVEAALAGVRVEPVDAPAPDMGMAVNATAATNPAPVEASPVASVAPTA